MGEKRQDRLSELEQKLQEARERQEVKEGGRHVGQTNAGAAWRMIIELTVGMIVGFGIGYGLDYLFGTLPIFLVIFCLLGFAAGVRVMIQTAREVQEDSEAARRNEDERDGK